MKVAIVIPCYNEATRIQLDDYQQFLITNPNITLVFCNDGSTDNTANILSKFEQDFKNAEFINNKINRGKAEAIRCAWQELLKDNRYDYLGFWDADLATPLEEITNATAYILKGYDHIICSRMKKLGSKIQRKLIRHILGRFFATAASTILELPVYDTQCGAKLFKSTALSKILNRPFITRWFFDIELIFRLKNENEANIYEMPVQRWNDVAGSKLELFDFIKAPFLLLKIYFHYRT